MLFMKGAGRNARPLFLFAPIGCKRRQKLKKGSDGAMQEDEEVVKSEAELVEKFKETINEYKPDILTGYFSDEFDPSLYGTDYDFSTNFFSG